MRVPDEIKKAVVFLGFRGDPDDPSTERFGGTGFLVGYECHGNVLFPYLVTADHVAKELEAQPFPVMRMNDKDGKACVFPLGFNAETPCISEWQRHADKSADVAVARFFVRGDYLAHVPLRMLLDDQKIKERGIGIGDETFMSGLFHFVRGKESNSPIVRVGNIAMMPDDRIYSGKEYGEMEAYLIEARSLGRLSGSPVFVRRTYSIEKRDPNVQRLIMPGMAQESYQAASEEFYLLGLAHAHWDIGTDEGLNGPAPTRGHSGVNMGVAIVTPAKKIIDVLDSGDLRRERETYLEDRERQSKSEHPGDATMDSDFTRDDFMDALKRVARRPSEDDISEESGRGQNPAKSARKKHGT